MDSKYDPTNLKLSKNDNGNWYKKESDDSTVKVDEGKMYNLPPLDGDKEVKERNLLKILTPNKLLTRLLDK